MLFQFRSIFFPGMIAFQRKWLSLFSDRMLLFLNSYHGNNKNITVVFQMCQTIHP